jgi:hypothetical protein
VEVVEIKQAENTTSLICDYFIHFVEKGNNKRTTTLNEKLG